MVMILLFLLVQRTHQYNKMIKNGTKELLKYVKKKKNASFLVSFVMFGPKLRKRNLEYMKMNCE